MPCPQKEEAAVSLRKLLSREHNPPIDEVHGVGSSRGQRHLSPAEAKASDLEVNGARIPQLAQQLRSADQPQTRHGIRQVKSHQWGWNSNLR